MSTDDYRQAVSPNNRAETVEWEHFSRLVSDGFTREEAMRIVLAAVANGGI